MFETPIPIDLFPTRKNSAALRRTPLNTPGRTLAHSTILIVCVSRVPPKIPYVGISPIRLQTEILLTAFLLIQFTLSISTTVMLPSVIQFRDWQTFPCVVFSVQSPFAPFPLQKLQRYYGLIRESYSPAEFRSSLISAALVE